MINILNKYPTLANSMLAALRDKNGQHDREKFRSNVSKLGGLMAYEISKTLAYREEMVETPLGKSHVELPVESPVLITVLRAGLSYLHGFETFFPDSDCGFIGAYRKEGEEEITINLDYLATPSLAGRVVIIIDPMLATGRSIIKAVESVVDNGTPSYIHVAGLVAAPEGVEFIHNKLKLPHTIWTWALDEGLNDKFYIVPGLGDAGDLSYGEKI